MSTDLFQAPDYFQLDELLNEEHKLVRDASRDWIKEKFHQLLRITVKKRNFLNTLLKV